MNSEQSEVRVVAPAKINYGLRIVGRRPDGYHELDSLFLPLDLADEVRVTSAPGVAGSAATINFTLCFEGDLGPASGDVPADRDNLAVRAARAFVDAAGISCQLKVSLLKRIPAAAGLGGGSRDAGAVLRALARIFPEALSPGALEDLALGLGADVPFFLNPRPARVGGIGETIEAYRAPHLTLLLANPGIPLSTAEVFGAFDAAFPQGRVADRVGAEHALTAPASASTLRPPEESARRVGLPMQSVVNDLESVAIALCPPIAILRDGLTAAGAVEVGMSGSGPTVFGVFGSREAAEAASKVLTEGVQGQAGESKELRRMRIWARVAATLHSV